MESENSLCLQNNVNEEVTPPILWDALKAVIRGKIITSYERRKREQKLKDLEKELKKFENEHARSPKKDSKCMITN